MSSQPSLVNELETTLATAPPERRLRMLRRISDAFIQAAARLKNEHIEVFDDVICCLTAEIETRALSELGLRFAPLPQAPPKTIGRLASHPDIAVAGPVLAQSERLPTPAIAAIAAERDQPHLMAISGRRRVDPAVTEVLVRRGNADVLRRLAGNAGAAFSDKGLNTLLERVAGDADAAEKIVQRHDMTPELLRTMVVRATDTVRKRLIGAAPPQRRGAVERLIARVEEELAMAAASDEHYYEHTVARLKEEHGGQVPEKDVFGFAVGKKNGEVVAALAINLAVPPEIVEDLMDGERLEPFLMMCKAANLRWGTVRAILELSTRPGRATQDGLTQACDDFTRLSPMVSQQALRLWQTKKAS
jgi:uncharacterized protein (DUF2336 family)